MMFIELMFWKNASVTKAVRDEYNWRVSLFQSQHDLMTPMMIDYIVITVTIIIFSYVVILVMFCNTLHYCYYHHY